MARQRTPATPSIAFAVIATLPSAAAIAQPAPAPLSAPAAVPADLRLIVENATDKSYWASAQSGILTIADPLTVKLGARFGF